MNQKSSDNNALITKLTALWALNESGLGGMMFALHIPLTGFFVGGFAVILISLIAFYSQNSFRQIMQATVLVLIVKATASPHAPPTAYLAVAFQGIVGAALFGSIRNHHKIAAILLAVLAMVESSLQKVIVTTLIYGKSIWVVLDKTIEGISKDFGIKAHIAYSLWIIGIYVIGHAVWGIMVGLFAGHLPRLINRNTPAVLNRYQQLYVPDEEVGSSAKKKNRFWLKFVLILILIAGALLLSGIYSGNKILYVIFRSVAAILLLFFVARPILTWLIQYWLKKRPSAVKAQAAEIMTMMPQLRSYVKPAWQMAKTKPGKNGRVRYFILSMIILSLYDK